MSSLFKGQAVFTISEITFPVCLPRHGFGGCSHHLAHIPVQFAPTVSIIFFTSLVITSSSDSCLGRYLEIISNSNASFLYKSSLPPFKNFADSFPLLGRFHQQLVFGFLIQRTRPPLFSFSQSIIDFTALSASSSSFCLFNIAVLMSLSICCFRLISFQ